MTTARALLIPPGSSGAYHCVQRCVRRAFLCGVDRSTGQSFEHRKQWLTQRLQLLSGCFAVAIHAYAIMSNHLHVVVQWDPAWQATWTESDVAERWVRLFPPRADSPAARALKCQRLLQQPERLALLRERLGNLSWFMKCLAEPIARAANVEDHCKGRFWEGRFKAQVLCDERALLAAMAYVDLNPLRAGMTASLLGSNHTSIQHRLRDAAMPLDQPLQPVLGQQPHVRLGLSLRAYIGLVEWTGQQLRPGKRGALAKPAPSALRKLDPHPERWALRVKAIGSGYWLVVGDVHDLLDAARAVQQRWLKGLGLARRLSKAN